MSVLLTAAIATRVSRNALRARLLQNAIATTRIGSTAIATSASCQSITIITATMITSPKMSPITVSTPEVSISCSTCTSEVTRDMIAPTSPRS